MAIVARHWAGDRHMHVIDMTLGGYVTGGLALNPSAVDMQEITAVVVENHGLFASGGSTWSYVAIFDAATSKVVVLQAPAGGGPLCECVAGLDLSAITLRLLVFGG